MSEPVSSSSLPSFLERVYVASPCDASWDSMEGNERLRNCGDCSRQVFNLSDMTRVEAEAFLRENGTSQCLRFYRRKDGTIMTDDCPVGLRKIRNAARRIRQVAALFFGSLISTCAVFAQSSECATSAKSEGAGSQVNRTLWRKPQQAQLHQLGVPDITNFRVHTIEVPSFSQLRSGKYALGSELVEQNGRMFIVNKVDAFLTKDGLNKEVLEPVPSVLTHPCDDLSAKILEAQGHIDAAEAFHKVYMKSLEQDGAHMDYYSEQIASDYRDFLFRQKRMDEARQIERDFSLEPEAITEDSDVLKALQKKFPLQVPPGVYRLKL